MNSKLITKVAFLSILGITAYFDNCLALDTANSEKPWVEGTDVGEKIPEISLPSFAPVIERLGKAVVNIRTEGKEDSNKNQLDPNNPLDFFLQMPPNGGSGGGSNGSQRKFSNLGSGFVIHPDGYIVTNFHVVEGASKIFVTFKDEKSPHMASIVGGDPKTDIALLKFEKAGKYESVSLGNSEVVKPGDWVIAIGNPFRLGHTATLGIVSAISRKLPGGKPYDDFIQTDASINPGNSGGPLFNTRGEVVGVNTAIYSKGGPFGGGGSIGIGFAIPVNLVKTIITQLKSKGKVTRGWLGVLIQAVDEDIAQAMKLSSAGGALVADVIKGSPAEKAGLKRGDVIVQFAGHDIHENSELPILVADTTIGKSTSLVYYRAGAKKNIDVVIEELKEGESEKQVETSGESSFGLSVQDLTPEIARSLGISEPNGVLVSDVEENSVASEAGIRRGDLILELDSKIVNTASEFRTKAKGIKVGIPVLLLIKRGESTIFLTLKPE